jgi:hypothetical protein
MEIYIGTLLFIFLLAFLEIRCKITKIQNYAMTAVLYLLIVLQIGLRWETGTDWNAYFNHFNDVDDISVVFLNALVGFEIGYGFFTYYIHKWFTDYSFFLLIHAVFFYGVIFRTARLFSPYSFVPLLVFYATSLGVVGSNRQLLALGICLLALPLIEKRKPILFFLIILLASLFHTTAIMFSVYYLFNRNLKWQIVISILIIAFVIGKTSLPLKLFSLGGILSESASSKVDFYSESAKDSMMDANLGIVGLFKRILFLGLFTYNFKYLSEKLSYYKIIYNGYAFGLFLYFLFSSSILIIINRGSLYFNVMESFLLASQFLIIKTRLERSYLLVFLLVLSLFLMFQSISVYYGLFVPYKGVFINSNFNRDLY